MGTNMEQSFTARKYHVTGRDDEGNFWTFSTDDAEQAKDMLCQMREDLQDVQLVDIREMVMVPVIDR